MGQIYAILLRIAAAGLLVAMSALVYEALKEATIGQAVFWRSLWSLPVILIYARCFGPLRGVLKTDHPFHHVRRGLLGLMAMGLHFMCLAHLPISYATALGFLTPILALPLAFAMLGERITRVLIVASFLGFGGVLLISFAQLENGGLPPASIIGIGAGLGFAAVMALIRVYVKRLTAKDSPSLIALSFSTITTLGGLAKLPFGWASLSNTAFFYLICAGVLGGLGHALSNESVKRSDIAVLGPFDYTSIIWALGIDVVIFGFEPNRFGMFGMTLIVIAGLSVAISQVKRRQIV